MDNIASLKAANPDWRHFLYDEAAALNFIETHYDPRTLNAFLAIDRRYGAARADYLRHLIIYRLGGVYLDIKSFADRPLNDIIKPDDTYLLSQWTDNRTGDAHEGFGLHRDLKHVVGGEYQTFHIIAAPQHPFSAAAIERITRNILGYRPWHSVGRNGVLRTTGPIAYTLAIAPIRHAHPHRMIDYRAEGLQPSIAYDHFAVFQAHYASLSHPVVRMGPVGRTASGANHRLRTAARTLIQR
ncbi:glycosyltransferase family 32 protein [Porphyrobacter sp. GA68]|uniref:glycosyltransferase family 32 protein n=1 Tax=Porphyrobacter sp. GA68 TaxID=2883480 RepID=UPI001D1818BA|nr:glycosyltransferase [Porphyrobacter sp. GA68]